MHTQALDVIYFSHNKTIYPVPNNIQDTHRYLFGFI